MTREKQLLLQRGMVQSLKQGVGKGLTRSRRITDTAAVEGRFVVVEIYAGVGNLTKVAKKELHAHCAALEPIDIIYGQDLKKKVTRDEVWQILYETEPDLVTLSIYALWALVSVDEYVRS